MPPSEPENALVVRLSGRQLAAVFAALGLAPTAMVAVNSPWVAGRPSMAQALNDNADFRELCVNVATVVDTVKEVRTDNKVLWQRQNDQQGVLASLVGKTDDHEKRIDKLEGQTP